MRPSRRRVLQLIGGAASFGWPRVASAQSYPSRPVRIIVGFPPGGTTDIGARLLAQWLTELYGQSFLIENRPGASMHAATIAVVRAPADGYTLLMVTGTNAVNPSLFSNLEYDFIRDIAPVASVFRSPFVLEVHPSIPASTIPELVSYGKANPGHLNIGSFGTGTGSHLSGELLKMMTGIEMQHVPYRGSAPMLVDLLTGQVQVAFDNLPASIEHIRAGKLRPLAVTTVERSEALPGIPAMHEVLPGYDASAWMGIGAPRDTPAEIVAKLNRDINAALADPKIKSRFVDLGGVALRGTPADFGKLIADETEKWGKLIRAAKIKLN